MIDRALITQAQKLINEARMIAEAPAAQAGEIGRGHPSSQMPPGAWTFQTSTLQTVGDRIHAAEVSSSDAQMQAAIRWATRELDALQHGSKEVAETPAQFEARIIRDYAGVTAPKVANAERTYVRRVRDIRVKHGRSTRFGHKLAGERER